jgi:ribosomal protein L35AE/L33A
MTAKFKVGDHVTWNSEAGHVSGTIVRVHTKEVVLQVSNADKFVAKRLSCVLRLSNRKDCR